MTKRVYRRNANVVRLDADAVYAARYGGKFRVNDDPELTDLEVEFLQQMLRDNRLSKVAEWIGCDGTTVLRVAAKCGFRSQPETMAKFRAFFHKADLRSVRAVPGRDSPQKRGLNGQRKTG